MAELLGKLVVVKDIRMLLEGYNKPVPGHESDHYRENFNVGFLKQQTQQNIDSTVLSNF